MTQQSSYQQGKGRWKKDPKRASWIEKIRRPQKARVGDEKTWVVGSTEAKWREKGLRSCQIKEEIRARREKR